MKRFTTPRVLLSALVLSLGLAVGAGYAAGPRGDCPVMGAPAGGPGAGPGMGMGMGMHQPMFHGRGIMRLHDELKLDAKQEALWNDAMTFARDNGGAMRERMIKEHEEIKAMLDKPGTDLHAVSKRMDDMRTQGMAMRSALHERWFAVYDALNPQQKEQVRVYFKDGMDGMRQGGPRGGDRRGQGQPRRDRPMQAPMQAPAPAPQS